MMEFKDKNRNLKFMLLLFAAGLVFFLMVGERGYIEMRDSEGYKAPNLLEGIMPVYSFFLNGLRCVFGEQYLFWAVVFQGIIASACVMAFICCLLKFFSIKKWEGCLLWFACLLPFSVELPNYIITHVIFTEGLSYSFYYIYCIFLLHAIFLKSGKWLWRTFGMAVFMGLLRSQLLLLFIIWAVTGLYISISKSKQKYRTMLKSGFRMMVSIAIGVILVMGMRSLYVNSIGKAFEKKFVPTSLISGTPTEAVEIEVVETEVISEKVEIAEKHTVYAQISSAIVARGFYEVDEEDIKYYKTDEMKEIFRRAYHACDEKRYRYVYAKKGLWMWEDLTQSNIYFEVNDSIKSYYEDMNISMDPVQFSEKQSQIKLKLGITEIIIHLGRFLYHCVRLMIPGFISCIFFNIEKVYFLCHLITLFLYGSAMTMAFTSLKNPNRNNAARFMIVVITGCIIFVGVTNLIFFGMQRYFLYQMGIFYCAYYLLFREYALIAIKKWNNRGN